MLWMVYSLDSPCPLWHGGKHGGTLAMLAPFPLTVADELACLTNNLRVRLERGELSTLEPVTFDGRVVLPFEQATRIVLAEYDHSLQRSREHGQSPTEEQQAGLLDRLREVYIRAVTAAM